MANPAGRGTCPRCSVVIQTLKESVPCAGCHRLFHITCIEGTYTEKEAAKFRKGPFRYLCYECYPIMVDTNILHPDTPNNAQIAKNKLKDEALKHQENLNKELTEQNKELNSRLLDFERELKELKDNTRKRPRVETENREQHEEILHLIEKINTKNVAALEAMTSQNLKMMIDYITKIENGFQESMDKMASSISQFKNNSHSTEIIHETVIEPSSKKVKFSRSRPRSSSNTGQKTKISYAAALAHSSTPIDAIRNLEIIGVTDNEKDAVLSQLRSDDICKDMGVTAIKDKGNYHITLKCDSSETARKIEDTLRKKYRTALSIKQVHHISPKIKITKIYGKLPTDQDIITQLQNQNHWLKNSVLTIARKYSIITKKKVEYHNIIINCDLKTQAAFLHRRSVIFGFAEYQCFEDIEVTQCFKCQRFGHLSSSCKFPTKCKHCLENHNSKECTHTVPPAKRCSNCIRSNKNQETEFNVHHSPSDIRCPLRTERVEALKKFYMTKNE